MKPYLFLSLLLLTFSLSCRQIYNPDIDATQGALVVESLITNQTGPYSVHLTKALPYDTADGSAVSVKNAKVYITDNYGHRFNFTESGSGYYNSKASDFTGITGVSYTLHIQTSDGNSYESSTQKMPSDNYSDSVYAEYTSKETLVEDYDGENRKITTQGVNLVTNINNPTDTLPRFRFDTSVYSEWIVSYLLPMATEPTSITFYGWNLTDPDDNVNLTQEKYSTSSYNIVNHVICFIPTVKTYTANLPDTTISAPIITRLIKVQRYRINDETFQYYKNINTLISAEGKIFDPIAMQITGNITCTSDPSKLALGFFEVSSLKTKTYSIRTGGETVIQQPNNWPSANSGFLINSIPGFWVN